MPKRKPEHQTKHGFYIPLNIYGNPIPIIDFTWDWDYYSYTLEDDKGSIWAICKIYPHPLTSDVVKKRYHYVIYLYGKTYREEKYWGIIDPIRVAGSEKGYSTLRQAMIWATDEFVKQIEIECPAIMGNIGYDPKEN